MPRKVVTSLMAWVTMVTTNSPSISPRVAPRVVGHSICWAHAFGVMATSKVQTSKVGTISSLSLKISVSTTVFLSPPLVHLNGTTAAVLTTDSPCKVGKMCSNLCLMAINIASMPPMVMITKDVCAILHRMFITNLKSNSNTFGRFLTLLRSTLWLISLSDMAVENQVKVQVLIRQTGMARQMVNSI